MGLGGSIFFLITGAILVFAVTPKAKSDVEWIDLTAVGWIFIIAGVVGVLMTTWYAQRRKQVHQEVHDSYRASRMARREAIRQADAARLTDRTDNRVIDQRD